MEMQQGKKYKKLLPFLMRILKKKASSLKETML
jgi:hypothetical protein